MDSISEWGYTSRPLAMHFEYTRAVSLGPYKESSSVVIAGTIKKADVTTKLIQRGNNVLVTYRSSAALNAWIPFGIGAPPIRDNIKEQLGELRSEIIRLQQISTPAN